MSYYPDANNPYGNLDDLKKNAERVRELQGSLFYNKSANTALEEIASRRTRAGPYTFDKKYTGPYSNTFGLGPGQGGKLLARRSRRVKSKSRRTKSKSRGTRRR